MKACIDSSEHPVQSVCVYQADRADIERVIPVSLEAGINEIVIEKLPNVIDSDSVRVEGKGRAVILDVTFSPPAAGRKSSQATNAGEELKTLELQIEDLKAERDVLNQQRSMLDSYSNTVRPGVADTPTLHSFLTFYKRQRQSIFSELQTLKKRLEETEGRVQEIRKALSTDADGQRRRALVTVIISAEAAGQAELTLKYAVSGASWAPQYDLRAMMPALPSDLNVISVQYRASISQSTGEDWDDVHLILSTATPHHGADIPILPSYRIGKPRPPPPMLFRDQLRAQPEMKKKEKARRQSRAEVHDESEEGGGEDMGSGLFHGASPLTTVAAKAVEGATSSTFVIPGQSTIPSDAVNEQQTHKVTICILQLQAKVEWIAIPKKRAAVFMKCKVRNTSEYILLPGISSVYVDGNYVCKSMLPLVAPAENFSTSLGVDPAIRITYHNAQKRRKASQGGLLASKTDISSFIQEISVKNTRATAVSPLLIKDQIPVSEHDDYKVDLVEPKMAGTAKDRNEVTIASDIRCRWSFKESDSEDNRNDVEEEGGLEWLCTAAAGTTVKLSLAWDVTVPAGQAWSRLVENRTPVSTSSPKIQWF